jgi:hypothetical protein
MSFKGLGIVGQVDTNPRLCVYMFASRWRTDGHGIQLPLGLAA